MAIFAITNEFVSINAVTLSDHCKNATLKLDVAQLDSTAFGSTWSTFIGGLKSGTLTLEFEDDYALASVDATLFPLLGTVVAFDVRADAGARSTTNPSYTGNILIATHSVGGSIGDLAMKSLSFPTSGAVTRAVA